MDIKKHSKLGNVDFDPNNDMTLKPRKDGDVDVDYKGGKMTFDEYIDEMDHLELQKIADEGSFLTQKRKRDKITRIKEAEGGRIGYESGKKVWPPKGPNPYGGFDPGTLPKNFMNKMPLIDPRLRDLIKEYKKRKGLAEILGV